MGCLHVKAVQDFDCIASDAQDTPARARLARGNVGGAACVEPEARWAAYCNATYAVVASQARNAVATKFLFAWRTGRRSIGIEYAGGGAEECSVDTR